MLITMALIHLVFIGHNKARLMDSIRKAQDYPVRKMILVTGEQGSKAEDKAEGIARELKVELSPLYDVEIVKIDKKDVMRGASQIIDLVMREKAKGNEALINMSGSLRTFSIAGYIAGCLTRSTMITSIPKYGRNDEEVGIEEIIEVPALPLNFLKPDQVRILRAIGDDTISLEELIVSLNPNIRMEIPDKLEENRLEDRVSYKIADSKPFPRDATGMPEIYFSLGEKPRKAISNERSRLIHHLKKFDEMGLIIREKKGKNVMVRLTDIGWMLKRAEK
jgi:CRISPR-associated protein Csa3